MPNIGDEVLRRMCARLNAGALLLQPLEGDRKMAKAVKLTAGQEFTFSSGGTPATKYPWDSWLDGGLWLIEQDAAKKDKHGNPVLKDGQPVVEKKDFDVDVEAMPAKLKTAARRRYKVMQISRKDASGAKLENSLIIRARDMSAEERVEEDQLRAEEKDAAKAKREEKKKASTNGTPGTQPATTQENAPTT